MSKVQSPTPEGCWRVLRQSTVSSLLVPFFSTAQVKPNGSWPEQYTNLACLIWKKIIVHHELGLHEISLNKQLFTTDLWISQKKSRKKLWKKQTSLLKVITHVYSWEGKNKTAKDQSTNNSAPQMKMLKGRIMNRFFSHLMCTYLTCYIKDKKRHITHFPSSLISPFLMQTYHSRFVPSVSKRHIKKADISNNKDLWTNSTQVDMQHCVKICSTAWGGREKKCKPFKFVSFWTGREGCYHSNSSN